MRGPSGLPLQGAKILVVDDNVDLAENLVEILEDEGALVEHAPTAARALALVRPETDVALVDIGLPDATGLDLVPTIREIGDGHIGVVLITGNASIEDAITAVQAGAYDYILKPFDPDVLIKNVSRAYAQVKLEREADLLANALRASEENLRTLVDAVSALLLVLDDHGLVIQANNAVLEVTGLEASDLEGQPWLDHHVPETEKPIVQAILDGLTTDGATASHAGRILRFDEQGKVRERWVRWQWTALRVGDVLRVYASGLDVTELRELERRTQLSQKLAAVGTLAAGLAHEIRNPLNAASLQMQLLERRIKRASDDAKLVEPIHVVQDEVRRLAHLVDDFLKFARPTGIRAKPVDVHQLVRRLVDLERPGAAEAGVDLAFVAESDDVEILGDAEKLQQVLLNLVRNAIQAADEDGHVEVTVRRDGHGARVCVRDDGPGIQPEHLPRIFEPFFSTKEGGTGLGMAICHSHVSLHGGDIQVRSQLGEGTEIEVTLPREPPRVEPTPTILGNPG